MFQAVTGQEYIAGLWKSHLVEYLDWRVYKPRAKISSEYRAPSWSWASVDGPVQPCGITIGSTYLVNVLKVNVSHSKIDPLGQVLSGFIVVKGLVVETSYHSVGHEGSLRTLSADNKSFSAHVYEDNLNIHFRDRDIVYCLALKCYPVYNGNFFENLALMGLLLHRKSQSTSDFFRVGHFHLNGRDAIRKFGVYIYRKTESSTRYSLVNSSVIRLFLEKIRSSI